MTKKDVARSLLGLADSMYREDQAGEENVDEWILRVLWAAQDLDPGIARHPWYGKLSAGLGESRLKKLRRLIEHPRTGAAEREAAVAALARVRSGVS
jgi:hypothetical protein